MLVSEESPPTATATATATHLKPSDVVETADLIRFNTSLQELRDIQSQLHYAADYCESTFLESNDKKEVVENTKEYICRAMVTMVDHLGNVSSNLTTRLSDASSFPDSDAQLRLNSLQQRIMSCGRLGSAFAMSKLRWSPAIPRYHSRYLMSPTDAKMSTQPIRAIGDKSELGREEGLPLFLYTFPMRLSVPSKGRDTNIDSTTIVPVRDGPTIHSKSPASTFQFQGAHYKKQRKGVVRKSVYGSDVLALIRRVRRMS